MKNCASGVIEVKTNHDGVADCDRNTTRVGFCLTLTQSDSTKVITELCQTLNTDLVKRFILFYDFIDRYGLGMIILPNILMNLGGSVSTTTLTQLDQFKIHFSVPLK